MKNGEDSATALVVPHTHWDRAWYWPFERFRLRLIECMKRVVEMLREHPDYCFTCDGQTLMLEDYLEVCPEDRGFLQECAQAGRLKVGPMYCLADLYCTGGEALIRNIQLGMAYGESFGGLQRTLHMPDTFGIIPSIPTIAEGFGIGSFTFMRGVAGEIPGLTDMQQMQTDIPRQLPEGTRMFVWKAIDGSEVRVMRLRDGYANAARLGVIPGTGIEPQFDVSKGAQKLVEAAKKQDDAQSEPLLLLAGVDHQIPQRELPEMMRQAEGDDSYRYRFAGLDDMAEQMERKVPEDLPQYIGEFHGSGAASVLGGTISARVYLKQTNAAVERLLCQRAETAAAFARLSGRADQAEAALLIAWKHLLQTHPHDDICGCSVDPVHQDNEYKMRQAADSGKAIERVMGRRILEVFGGHKEGEERFGFFVLSTQNSDSPQRFRVTCDFEGLRSFGDYQPPENIEIVDEQGKSYPFVELYRGRGTVHPHPIAELEMSAALEPFALKRFYIQEAKEPREERCLLENEFLKVTPHANGSFDLLDKNTGRTWPRLGLFSGQADIGDTYDFADIPDEDERVFDDLDWSLSSGDGCGGMQSLTLRANLRIPESSTREGRSGKLVQMPVEVNLSLAPHERALQCRVTFTNTARDHRLRWNMPFEKRPDSTLAGLKFHQVRRPLGSAPAGNEAPRVFPEHPGDSFVAAADENGGLACFSEFPFNYEFVSGDRNRLALTLFRAVGYLCNPQPLTTRKGNHAGPHTPTPDAQCLGRCFQMKFAICPYSAEGEEQLQRQAMIWRSEPVYGQVEFHYPQRTQVQEREEPFVEVPEPLVVSAFKPAQGQGGVLRLFNPTGTEQVAEVRVKHLASAWSVPLTEKREQGQTLPVDDRRVPVRIAPFGLFTISFDLERPWAQTE